MANVQTFPLPPLMLTEVIDKCRDDHTHRCDESCIEEPEYHADATKGSCDMEPVIVHISAGHGRHTHDDNCYPNCMCDCDDADWIVELQYHTRGYHAVYGVKRSGDVQDVQLWMD